MRHFIKPKSTNKSDLKPNAFTLIEVLITLFIVSFAMLGIAKLQLITLQQTHNSYINSQASFLINQIIEKIRVNSSVHSSYSLLASDAVNFNIDCSQTLCTPTEIAQYDLATWMQQVNLLLPYSKAGIVVNQNQIKITVYWDSNRDGSSGLNCPNLTNDDLDCNQLTITLY